ncbi:6-hydroxypseudooxynicotine dehydrogenase complex subunit alpha (plasmid) [Roseovarius sp. THAF9]|uniref:FAD binding domain-containing protein n=1 Tax=Roseovarius sp. THAF9 TaxID=2587847 RepID=UPI0012682B5D|nr:xanthine dehydrogenase family protein subunit M [Roseovarius sp. THAF9]QFT95559.1 6-hydroxypseudooxynicotine dehydrogenase complex subunit alpha [Roseovarius sp. THAF9]
MKSYAFEYTRVSSLDEALECLKEDDEANIIAGGQSLMPMLAMRLAAPSRLVDIGGLKELRGIEVTENCVRIGALARHVEVLKSDVIASSVPLLARAIREVAHPAIRNRGTFGGSVCLADPAAEIPAVCVALNATFEVAGPNGRRMIPAREFFVDVYETALLPGEVMIAAELPVSAPGDRVAFHELARRHGDFAIVGVALRGNVLENTLQELDICVFGASSSACLVPTAARELVEIPYSPEAVEAACASLSHVLTPQEDAQATSEMRCHLARVLLRRGLADLMNNEALR